VPPRRTKAAACTPGSVSTVGTRAARRRTYFGIGIAVVVVALTACGATETEDPQVSEYEQCVNEASDHLQSAVGLSEKQARSQAADSPRCSPLKDKNANIAPTVPPQKPIEYETTPARTAYLIDVEYEGVCMGRRAGSDKSLKMDYLNLSYAPALSEKIYAESLRRC